MGLWPLFSSGSFGSAFMPKDVFSFAWQIKLCWTLVHPSLQIFAVVRQNQGNHKLPRHIWCCFSDLTWLKQPGLRLHEGEAKPNRSPTVQKFPWWKMNTKKTQPSGSDRKPSVLETETAKTNLTESSCGSVSDTRRHPVKVGCPLFYDWKDIWLTKS